MTVTQDRTSIATAAASRPRGSSRIAALDGLRLVAALMVVMYHFTAFTPGVKDSWGVKPTSAFPQLYHFTEYGYMGVELFFIISGFVICMSSWGRTAGGFFRSRVVRLFPAYWPAVLITTAVVTILPTVQKPHRFNEVLVNLTMLNAPIGVRPVDGVYWSLWAEARFYLLFAVALLIRGQLTLHRATIFGYAWIVAGVVAQNSDEPLLKIIFQPEYAPLFVAGIAFYLIHRFGGNIKIWGLLGVSYLLAAHNAVVRLEGVGPRNLQRELSPTVGFLLITAYFLVMFVIAMGWTSRIQWRWLTTAGLLTYPLYLLHENIGWALIHAMRDARPRWAVLFLVIAIMMVTSWLLHKLIEKPLARRLKKALDAASGANHLTPGAAGKPGDPGRTGAGTDQRDHETSRREDAAGGPGFETGRQETEDTLVLHSPGAGKNAPHSRTDSARPGSARVSAPPRQRPAVSPPHRSLVGPDPDGQPGRGYEELE